MDYSKEIAERFKLEEEIISNGNGTAKTQPKKIISQEEINQTIGMMMETLEESEEGIREAGYDDDSLILLYESIYNVLAVKIKELKGENVQLETQAETTTSAIPEKTIQETPKTEEKKNWIDYVYDFETLPPLTCKFIGAGPVITAEGRPLKTWKVQEQDEKKTEWLLPQWAIFSEVQGSFLGFEKEQAGKFVYLLTFKGAQPVAGGVKYMVQVMKKFA